MASTNTKTVTKRKPRIKPEKPYKEFPLFPHDCGQWAKKINGRMHYFGVWEDPTAARDKYMDQRDDLHAGRTPRHTSEKGVRLIDLVNSFIHDKKILAGSGELSSRAFDDYKRTGKMVADFFGRERRVEDLRPEDFSRLREQIASTRGVTATGNEIGRVRVLFNYGSPDRSGILKEAVKFGVVFRRPSKKSQRIHRAAKPTRMFTPETIQAAINEARPQLQAMTLLAINCGLGNNDCAQLERRHLDLAKGWLTYPRPKTGIWRRAKLWPETIETLRAVLNKRPDDLPTELAPRVFITKYRKSWEGTNSSCPISHQFRKLLIAAKVYRTGLSFYSLRHTFQTVGERSGDQTAVAVIMGHADESMAAVYREHFDDARLERVTETVRAWVYE